MELLRADITFRRDGRELLRDVSLTLRPAQRLGLVGRNGAGKSTLLSLLAGDLSPSEGRVRKSPGVRLFLGRKSEEYAPRGAPKTNMTVWEAGLRALAHVRDLEAALRGAEKRLSTSKDIEHDLARYAELTERFEAAGGYAAEGMLERTLATFGFGPLDYATPAAALSGGERARLELALAFTAQPDVLLLDEPSSHLDLVTRPKLAEQMKRYPGALLFASHDRALLNAVCTHVLHLEAGTLTRYKGNYSSFRQTQGFALRTAQKRAKERGKEVAALSTSAERLKGWGTPTAARQRRSALKRLERLQDRAVAPRPSTPKELPTASQKAKGTLLSALHLSKRYGERTLIGDVSLRVEAGDKVALVGANGAGKSTLLELLTGELESDHAEAALHFGRHTKVAVFDQETRGLAADAPLLAQLTRYVSEPRARMLLALVALADAADKMTSELSEGQKARAGIALILASEANLLILDEPTEHLDIEMIGRLQGALQGTDAAFVLVSHDAALVEVATRVLSLEAGELKEYRGGLKGYFRGTLRLEPDLPALDDAPVGKESLEDELERLELSRLELEEARLTSYHLSERERVRLERRYADLLDDLFALYETRHFVPAPLYRKREGVVYVEVEAGETGYLFSSNVGLGVRLLVDGSLGHLSLIHPDGRCVLPWARDAALRTVVRIALEHLALHALQIQSEDDLSAAGLAEAGGDWWVLSRRRYEVAQGYVREDRDSHAASGRFLSPR